MNNQNPLYLHTKSTCTSEALRNFPKKENFEGLSADQKGFWYEGYVQYLLDMNDVNYEGNPISFEAWKDNPTKGHDIIVKYPNGTKIRVECKFTLNHLYPCWIKEDWLSRDADIIVTNDVHAVPYRERILLRKQGKKLMSTTEFIMYIQKMIGGNQRSWNNALVDTIRVYIENRLSIVLAVLMLFNVQGSTGIKCKIGKIGKCVRRLSTWK